MTNENLFLEIKHIALAYFLAYEAKDLCAMQRLLSSDFTFGSPDDQQLNKEEYFKKCWPFNERSPKYTFQQVLEDENSGFVFYHCEMPNGDVFENTEYFIVENNLIKQVRVFYGGPAVI